MQLKLQIVYPDGVLCSFRAGGEAEIELINTITEEVIMEVMKNFSRFHSKSRTELEYKNAISGAVHNALLRFKMTSKHIELRHG